MVRYSFPLPRVVDEVDAAVEVEAVDREGAAGVIDHPAVVQHRLGGDDLREEAAEVGGRQAGAEFAVAELVGMFHKGAVEGGGVGEQVKAITGCQRRPR